MAAPVLRAALANKNQGPHPSDPSGFRVTAGERLFFERLGERNQDIALVQHFTVRSDRALSGWVPRHCLEVGEEIGELKVRLSEADLPIQLARIPAFIGHQNFLLRR